MVARKLRQLSLPSLVRPHPLLPHPILALPRCQLSTGAAVVVAASGETVEIEGIMVATIGEIKTIKIIVKTRVTKTKALQTPTTLPSPTRGAPDTLMGLLIARAPVTGLKVGVRLTVRIHSSVDGQTSLQHEKQIILIERLASSI